MTTTDLNPERRVGAGKGEMEEMVGGEGQQDG